MIVFQKFPRMVDRPEKIDFWSEQPFWVWPFFDP